MNEHSLKPVKFTVGMQVLAPAPFGTGPDWQGEIVTIGDQSLDALQKATHSIEVSFGHGTFNAWYEECELHTLELKPVDNRH